MIRSPVDIDHFLTPEQAATIKGFEDMRRQLEFPPEGHAQLVENYEDTMWQLWQLTHAEAMYQREEVASLVLPVTNLSDLEQWVKIDGRRAAINHSVLTIHRHSAMILAGDAIAGDDEPEVEKARQLGSRAMELRSKKAAAALLLGWAALANPHTGIGEELPVWQRSIEAYSRAGRDIPRNAQISDVEATSIVPLIDTAIEYQQASSNRLPPSGIVKNILNEMSQVKDRSDLIRLADDSTFVPQPGVSPLEHLLGLFNIVTLGPTLNITSEQLDKLMPALRNVARFIVGAATYNQAIAADPRARYFTFLMDRLSVVSGKEERQTFDRDARRVARSLGHQK